MEKLKQDILQKASLVKLPKKMTNDTAFWITAIAKVKKDDFSECYAILKRKTLNSHSIIYINGNVSRIKEILEIMPIETLDTKFIKKFKSDKLEDRIKYLKGYYDMDLESLSLEELNTLIIDLAIKRHLDSIARTLVSDCSE